MNYLRKKTLFLCGLLASVCIPVSFLCARRTNENAVDHKKSSSRDVSLRPLEASSNETINTLNEMSPVPLLWKDSAKKNFTVNASFLQDVIFQGEVDGAEKQDFERLFSEQKTWFDTTLSSTTYFFDPHYNAVMKKQKTIDELTKAQKKADSLIIEKTKPTVLAPEVHNKIRLIVLYELNALLKQLEGVESPELTDKQIESIVHSVLSQAQVTNHPVPLVLLKNQEVNGDVQVVQQLKKRIEQLQNDLKVERERTAKELAQSYEALQKVTLIHQKTESELAQKAEHKEKRLFGLQLELEKTKRDAQVELTRVVQQERSQAQRVLRSTLEQKNKENISLQIHLEKVQQRVASLEHKLQKTTEKINSLRAELQSSKQDQQAQREDLRLMLEEGNKKHLHLQTVLARAHEHVHILQKRIEGDQQQVRSLNLQVELERVKNVQLQAALKKSYEQVSSFEQKMQLLSDTVHKAHEKAMDSIKQAQSFKGKADMFEGLYAQAQQEAASLKSVLAEQQQIAQTATKNIVSLLAELDVHYNEMNKEVALQAEVDCARYKEGEERNIQNYVKQELEKQLNDLAKEFNAHQDYLAELQEHVKEEFDVLEQKRKEVGREVAYLHKHVEKDFDADLTRRNTHKHREIAKNHEEHIDEVAQEQDQALEEFERKIGRHLQRTEHHS